MYYRIPICVINDPIKYSVESTLQKLAAKTAPKEQQISVSNSKSLNLRRLKSELLPTIYNLKSRTMLQSLR